MAWSCVCSPPWCAPARPACCMSPSRPVAGSRPPMFGFVHPLALLLRGEGYPVAVAVALLMHGVMAWFLIDRNFTSSFVSIQEPQVIMAATVAENPQQVASEQKKQVYEQQLARQQADERERRLTQERQQAEAQRRQAEERAAAEAERQRQAQAQAERQKAAEAERQKS